MQKVLERRPDAWDEASTSHTTFWIALMLLVAGAITIGALFWIADHPYGTWYDEARHIDRAYLDSRLIRDVGVIGFARILLNGKELFPPAYRLVALPASVSLGATTALLRVVSLATLWATLAFVYLTGRRLAGPVAGALAACIVVLSPSAVNASKQFLTEYPLYLAIAATLFYLFREWNAKQPSRGWIGLGLALGLGMLAKTSFVFVAAPLILASFVLNQRGMIISPNPAFLARAIGLGTALALPWWVLNFRPAVNYASNVWHFERLSLGPPGSLHTLLTWLRLLAQSLLGPGVLLVLIGILAVYVTTARPVRVHFDGTQKPIVWTCVAAALPLIVAIYLGYGDKQRLVSPSLLPIAVASGVLVVATGLAGVRLFRITVAVLFCLQAAAIVVPVVAGPNAGRSSTPAFRWLLAGPAAAMQRSEQWDWSALRELSQARGLRNPSIVYLGNSRTLNPPQIRFPWIQASERVRVTWVWRYEQGPINWEAVMAAVDSSDVVLVVPGVVGDPAWKEDLDNQHNTELFQRMSQRPGFSKPTAITMGRLDPVQVYVFFRNTH